MIKVYFDGSCEPNPGGRIGYGAAIYQHDKIIHVISKILLLPPLDSTNNVAEYCGCIAAMKYLISKGLNEEEIFFFGDSQLVIQQMRGSWQIGEGKYVKFANIAKNYLKKFPNINFEWISKDRNGYADLLSRRIS